MNQIVQILSLHRRTKADVFKALQENVEVIKKADFIHIHCLERITSLFACEALVQFDSISFNNESCFSNERIRIMTLYRNNVWTLHSTKSLHFERISGANILPHQGALYTNFEQKLNKTSLSLVSLSFITEPAKVIRVTPNLTQVQKAIECLTSTDTINDLVIDCLLPNILQKDRIFNIKVTIKVFGPCRLKICFLESDICELIASGIKYFSLTGNELNRTPLILIHRQELKETDNVIVIFGFLPSTIYDVQLCLCDESGRRLLTDVFQIEIKKSSQDLEVKFNDLFESASFLEMTCGKKTNKSFKNHISRFLAFPRNNNVTINTNIL